MDRRTRKKFQRKIKKRGIQKKAQRRRRKNKNKVFHKKINKRKYYGVGVDIDEYEELIENSIDYDELDEYLSTLREKTLTESYIDDARNLINNVFDTGMMQKVKDLFTDAHDKGTKRVFDKEGEQIDTGDVDPRGVEQLANEQRDYIENLHEDAGEKVEEELTKAMEEGESIPEARDRLMNELDGLTKNRAETIARSEIIKASSKGTEDAMDEAGIDEVIWIATEDNRVCEDCKALHMKPFKREKAPTPVESTHPNCRCTVAADI